MNSRGILNVEETIRLFKSYGLKVDENSVNEWVRENNKKISTAYKRQVIEDDLYRYNDWCRVKGTHYEEGIDDKTKIARLLEEVASLKKQVEQLKSEKLILEAQLEIDSSYWE